MNHAQGTYKRLLFLTSIYLSINIIGRWLRWPIFHNYGAYGWAQPDIGTYAMILAMCVIPVIFFQTAVFQLTWRFVARRRHVITAAFVLFLGLMYIESDMSWFQISKRHIGLSEIAIFMSEFGREFGVSPTDYLRFAGLAGMHALAFTAIYFISTKLAARQKPSSPRLPVFSSIFITLLFLVDIIFAGRAEVHGNQQVAALSYAHPLRLSAFNSAYARLSGYDDFIDSINAKYNSIEAIGHGYSNALIRDTEPLPENRYNVLVLAIEGFNANYADMVTSLKEIAPKSITALNNYSTGDATHYGMLGLIYGKPVFFYGDHGKEQSKYVFLFNANGFETERFGIGVSSFGDINKYTENFSLPLVEPKTDWSMLEDIHGFFDHGSYRKLAMVYYESTHWPYLHLARFNHHEPEVAEDFDYSVWNVVDYKDGIINRYKNCIDELDAWLHNLFATLDMRHTIIVITGDHGEEMFEHGRLSHAGGLWEGQIRVPLLIYFPDGHEKAVSSISSHADIMPALAYWLGLEHDNPRAGAEPINQYGYAIAAHNNHTAHPEEWVFVDASYRIFFGQAADGKFVITGVSDKADKVLTTADLSPDSGLITALRQLKGVDNEVSAAGRRSRAGSQ